MTSLCDQSSRDSPEVQLSKLLEELKNGCFDYLNYIEDNNNNNMYNWSSLILKRRGTYPTPKVRELHRQIIREIIRHRKFDSLDPDTELRYSHWVFVLLEALRSKSICTDLITRSTRRLNIYTSDMDRYDRPATRRIIKELITDCEPSDIIFFFNHCKTLGNETYITYRGELLKELLVWDEDSLPLSSRDFVDKFNEKWKQDPASIEYVNKMYREEQTYELTFMEVFQQLNESIRERKTSAHAEYVIAEMVLEDKVLKDILKHIIQPYL